MASVTTGVLNFIEYTEGLKRELRNSWLSDSRKESVAEHSWRMAIMAIAISPKTGLNLNMEKVLKLVAVHDIVEIEAGDVPTIYHMTNENIANKKKMDEATAINNIKCNYDKLLGKEIHNLWREFEDQVTTEAKFVKILDKFEAIIQKYQASFQSFEKQSVFNRTGAPGYFEKLEKMCEIDQYLVEMFQEIVTRKDKVKEDREKRI